MPIFYPQTNKFLGSPEETERLRLNQEVGKLVSNPAYRDIPANLVPDFYSGRISFEDLQAQISGSPVFNPAAGPQINTGQGQQPLTNIQPSPQLGGGFTAQAGGQPIQTQGTQPPVQPQQQSIQQPQQPIQPQQAPQTPQSPPQAPQTAQNLQQPILPIGSYSGVSIVDYLNSTGQVSDFASRQRLAQQFGIQNYVGSAEQNTQLLNLLKQQQPAPITPLPQQPLSLDSPLKKDELLTSIGFGKTGELTDTNKTDAKSLIQNLADAFGLTDVKKSIATLDNQLADDIAFINENPWISEGLRSKKMAALQGKYESKKDSLIDQLKYSNETINQAISLYNKERELKQQLIIAGIKDKQDLINKQLLTPATIQSTINQITSNFDNEQVVKNFNTSAGGFQTMANIKNNTSNPADDIAMIYQFAKIMDPNSVVREGEYAVVQRYAQSWAQSFGFNAARIFSNTKFLTSQAISNMKAAANAKFQADKSAYVNLASEYNRRIKEAQTGQIGGSIPNYAAGFEVFNQPDISNQTDNQPNNIEPDNVPIGETFSAGGILYLRTGADEFEPIGNVK